MKNISKWLLTILVAQWIAIPVIAATGPFTAYQTLTAQALNNALAAPNIIGGTIDNTVIGGNTPVSIYASLGNIGALNASNVSVTNNISASGTVAASSVNVTNALNAGTVSAVISATSIGGASLSVAYAVNATNAVSSVSATNSTYATNIAGKTQYGVLYQSASGVTASTTAGTTGQVLTSNGTTAPTFQNATGATLSANQTFTGVNTFSNASSTFAGNATTATNLLGGTVQGTQLGFQTGAGVGGTVSMPYGSGPTLNKMSGQIIVQASNYSAGNMYFINVLDSNVTANDVVVVSWAPGSVAYAVLWTNVYAGEFTINVYILANSATAQPNYINFVVIKNSVN
jgi:hypothetical protein